MNEAAAEEVARAVSAGRGHKRAKLLQHGDFKPSLSLQHGARGKLGKRGVLCQHVLLPSLDAPHPPSNAVEAPQGMTQMSPAKMVVRRGLLDEAPWEAHRWGTYRCRRSGFRLPSVRDHEVRRYPGISDGVLGEWNEHSGILQGHHSLNIRHIFCRAGYILAQSGHRPHRILVCFLCNRAGSAVTEASEEVASQSSA